MTVPNIYVPSLESLALAVETALFHVSEDGSIARFEPRHLPAGDGVAAVPLVWAIDREHLPNYLLPRDCPRVTFFACADSRPDDIHRLMGPSTATRVIAIESDWLERAIRTPLYVYEFAPAGFRVLDAGAGYHVSEQPVVPTAVHRHDQPVSELLRTCAELRVVPSLWPLRDAVVSSSLQYSCIRLRNARPRSHATSETN